VAPRATSRRRTGLSGAQPLAPQRKWLLIAVATIMLAVAMWSMLAGLIVIAAEEDVGGPNPAAAIAFGLALIPFVFIVLAFGSGRPRAPGAVVKAMVVCLLVGIPVSALARDGVTGIVAGVGAGGILALREDLAHNWRSRALGVIVATMYTFVLVRLLGELVLLPAPVFPFTSIGIADHLSERRREREASELEPADSGSG
jgi:hypothetical protein